MRISIIALHEEAVVVEEVVVMLELERSPQGAGMALQRSSLLGGLEGTFPGTGARSARKRPIH